MTPAQCKAARALLGMSETDLAIQSGIDIALIRDFETRLLQPTAAGLAALTTAFDMAGVVFIDNEAPSSTGGAGLRLKTPSEASFDVIEREVVQYPEFLENDAPPGAGG